MEEGLGMKVAARKFIDTSATELTRQATKQFVSGYSTWKIQDASSRIDGQLVPEEMLQKISTNPCSVSDIRITNQLAFISGGYYQYLLPSTAINLRYLVTYTGNCNGGASWSYAGPDGSGTFNGDTGNLPSGPVNITVTSNDKSTVKKTINCFKGNPTLSGPTIIESRKSGTYSLYVIVPAYPVSCIWSINQSGDYASIDGYGVLTTNTITENKDIIVVADIPYYGKVYKPITITGLKQITITGQDNLGSSNTGSIGVPDGTVIADSNIGMSIGYTDSPRSKFPGAFQVLTPPNKKVTITISALNPIIITSSDFDISYHPEAGNREATLTSKQNASEIDTLHFTVINR